MEIPEWGNESDAVRFWGIIVPLWGALSTYPLCSVSAGRNAKQAITCMLKAGPGIAPVVAAKKRNTE
jgi:hypothetical protein